MAGKRSTRELERIARTAYSPAGFARGYAGSRPSPPKALLDVLVQLCGDERPRLVIDLGCGTGLSTRAWAGRAGAAVGVELNRDMLREAEAETRADNVRYVHASAAQTGLADGAADIVTCSQSFHWMEPRSTLAEAARVLRVGGVFAAYDYDWPPAGNWEVEREFGAYQAARGAARRAQGWSAEPGGRKREHLDRIRESGDFRYVRELCLHGTLEMTARRVVALALSLGPLDVTQEELGLPALRQAAECALGERTETWYLGYRVRLGVK